MRFCNNGSGVARACVERYTARHRSTVITACAISSDKTVKYTVFVQTRTKTRTKTRTVQLPGNTKFPWFSETDHRTGQDKANRPSRIQACALPRRVRQYAAYEIARLNGNSRFYIIDAMKLQRVDATKNSRTSEATEEKKRKTRNLVVEGRGPTGTRRTSWKRLPRRGAAEAAEKVRFRLNAF